MEENEIVAETTTRALMFFDLPLHLNPSEYMQKRRFRRYISQRGFIMHYLCQFLGLSQVAHHFGTDHTTVRHQKIKWDDYAVMYPEKFKLISEHYSAQMQEQLRHLINKDITPTEQCWEFQTIIKVLNNNFELTRIDGELWNLKTATKEFALEIKKIG